MIITGRTSWVNLTLKNVDIILVEDMTVAGPFREATYSGLMDGIELKEVVNYDEIYVLWCFRP